MIRRSFPVSLLADRFRFDGTCSDQAAWAFCQHAESRSVSRPIWQVVETHIGHESSSVCYGATVQGELARR